jgi:Xaa-Pro aminopeptidase
MLSRLQDVRAALPAGSALLVKSEPNRFYLTGFRSSDGFLLISRDRAVFYTDSRYIEAARAAVGHLPVSLSTNPMVHIREWLAEENIGTLYIEADATTVRSLAALRKALDGVTIAEEDTFDRLIADLRSVKSDTELAAMRRAQEMTDDTFAYIAERIAAGRTERDVMLDMEMYMRRLGSEGVAFNFVVVSGKNSSLPHGVPTDKVIERGDFVTMDFGAVVNGYRSDMTRTVAVGTISDEQRRVYDTVLEAQTAALAAIRAGVVCKDVDKVARDLIARAGYGDCFGHALGHSVGIAVHEAPTLSTRCDTVLKAGTMMTVEPGIYLEGKFGVRIEDMVLITEDGYENFTKSPKNLLIL